MVYKYIFWDWNGTLLDDAKAAWSAVNIMLESRGRLPITFEQYRDYIDVPIIRFYEKVMDMSNEDMNAVSVEFDALWRENLQTSPLAICAFDILNAISKNGIKQYIFSSSRNELIEPFLKNFSIDHNFEIVLGAPDRYVGSKAERTKDYIVKNNIPVEEILFIGDMVHDSDVASFVGADCILVSNGHQSETALLASGRKVISSLSELKLYLDI